MTDTSISILATPGTSKKYRFNYGYACVILLEFTRMKSEYMSQFHGSGSNCLGCPENAKSLKSQAPQGFSGCLDIENDEMNKNKFLSASPRVNQTLRSL